MFVIHFRLPRIYSSHGRSEPYRIWMVLCTIWHMLNSQCFVLPFFSYSVRCFVRFSPSSTGQRNNIGRVWFGGAHRVIHRLGHRSLGVCSFRPLWRQQTACSRALIGRKLHSIVHMNFIKIIRKQTHTQCDETLPVRLRAASIQMNIAEIHVVHEHKHTHTLAELIIAATVSACVCSKSLFALRLI